MIFCHGIKPSKKNGFPRSTKTKIDYGKIMFKFNSKHRTWKSKTKTLSMQHKNINELLL